jgi:tetratricopeptide (TPR) repeat protein
MNSGQKCLLENNREGGSKKLSPISRTLVIFIVLLLFVVPLCADKGSDLAAKGTTLMGQGRYSEAISAFDSALALNPDNLQARVGKGSALFSAGRPSESLLSFDIALNQNPSFVPALVEKGRVLLATGNPQEALSSYNQALQFNHGSSQALEGKGDALFSLGQGGDAIAAWNEALLYDPGNSRLQGKIASAQENSGIPLILWILIVLLIVLLSLGLFLYMKFSRKGKPGKKTAIKNVFKKNNSNDKPAKNKKISSPPILLTRPGDKEGPASVKESHLERIHRMIDRTGLKVHPLAGKKSAGNMSVGMTCNDGLPGNGSGMAGSSELHLPDIDMAESLKTSSSSDSIIDITRSLEVLLKSGDCIYSGDGLKGILLYSNREYEAAIQEFDKEIANYPDVICVTLLKVRALMHLERFSEAFDTDRKVLKLAKDNYEAIVLAALLGDQLGHLDFGLRACNKAISVRYHAPIIWALKGTILHKMGNYPEALASFKQSLDLDSESGVVWKEYGEVLSKAGMYPEAIGAFEKVILLSGEDPEIRARIADCLENINVRPDGLEKASSSGIRSEKPSKTDFHPIRNEVRDEHVDTEHMDPEFFPAIDQQNLIDWSGSGAHEQKS